VRVFHVFAREDQWEELQEGRAAHRAGDHDVEQTIVDLRGRCHDHLAAGFPGIAHFDKMGVTDTLLPVHDEPAGYRPENDELEQDADLVGQVPEELE
jgi:hypothetical protein